MNKIHKYHRIIFVFLALLFVSCEKEITLDLPQSEDKTVIEGEIELGEYACVIITKNSSYFDPVVVKPIIDYISQDILDILPSEIIDTLKQIMVPDAIDTNAIVTVSDGSQIDTLELSFDYFRMPFIMYKGNKIKGETGKTYKLQVITGGKTYTSTTTIPIPVELDSIRFKYVKEPEDSIGFVWIYFHDPPALGNFYRGYTKTLGKDNTFVHPYSSVSDDLFANGKQISYALNRGWDPAQGDAYFDDDNTFPWWSFIVGETVVVKLSTLDATHYDFWYSIEIQVATDGNPFASPISIRTNIEGGAIGIWGGYGAYLDTIKIDESVILL